MKFAKTSALAGFFLLAATAVAPAADLSPVEQLGKNLFFDTSLSNPPGQSCASCHDPATGWTGPDSEINATQAIMPGAVFNRAGNRKPPTAAYGGFNPILHKSGMGRGRGGGGMMADGSFAGGHFWDGRATGWTLGDPLSEQAMGPFLNPLEQNNPNAKHVCLNVQRTDYAVLFDQV